MVSIDSCVQQVLWASQPWVLLLGIHDIPLLQDHYPVREELHLERAWTSLLQTCQQHHHRHPKLLLLQLQGFESELLLADPCRRQIIQEAEQERLARHPTPDLIANLGVGRQGILWCNSQRFPQAMDL